MAKKGWKDVERRRTAIPRHSKLSNLARFHFLCHLKPVFAPVPTPILPLSKPVLDPFPNPFLPLSTPVLALFLYCLAIISRCVPVAAIDVPLAENPSTGTAQQRLILVLKVVLHTVVVTSEVLSLSTKSPLKPLL